MISRLFRIVAVAVVAYLAISLAPASAGAATGSCDLGQYSHWVGRWKPDAALQVVAAINSDRAARGLSPLQSDTTLWQGAMWEASYFSMTGGTKLATPPCAEGIYGDMIYGKDGSDPQFTGLIKELEAPANGGDKLFASTYRSIGVGVVDFGFRQMTIVLLGSGEAQTPPAPTVSAKNFSVKVAMTRSGGIARYTNLISKIEGDSGYFALTSMKAKHGWTALGGANDDPARYARYSPNAGFHGIDTITYTISDLYGRTATGKITVVVGDGKQKIAAKKRVAKPKMPKLYVSVGGSGNKVYLSQFKMILIGYSTQKAGVAHLAVRKNGRVVGSLTTHFAKINGGFLPLAKVVPASRLSVGSYTLTVSEGGSSTTITMHVLA